MDINQTFQLPGFTIKEVLRAPPNLLIVKATSDRTQAECPYCLCQSQKKHSQYDRSPKMLPWGEDSVRLSLTVQRFFCENTLCPHITFAERIPHIVLPHAQRTVGLTKVLQAIAFETSAESASRIARHLHIPISGDTILRILRNTRLPDSPCPRVLGVDDWALKRGQLYGTILVDLETHQPVDLLAGRSAEVLKAWLENHPEVQFISRDRSKEYKAAIDAALPDAIQIVDRWHLYLNLRERIEKTLAKKDPNPQKTAERPISQRQKWFDYVRYLHARGYSTRVIARVLGMNRNTVIKYIHADHLPDWKKGMPRRSKLESYDRYLRKRWQEGCRSASVLWRELKDMGYAGQLKSVRRYLRRYRQNRGRSPRQTAWLFMTDPKQLLSEDAAYLNLILSRSERLNTVYLLSQAFIQMLSARDSTHFDHWLQSAERCGVRVFEHFALGLRQDYQAVKAALDYQWSNGQTEGQVTRLKLIKRQMYGRAKFDLLRIRILGPP